MKLLIIYAQLFLVLLNTPTAATATYILTFGKGDDCSGFNICNISDSFDNGINENQARVMIRLKDGRVEFEFIKQSISDQAFLKFFSTGYFILDADYYLPSALVNELGIKTKLIKAGKYKINASGDSYIILF